MTIPSDHVEVRAPSAWLKPYEPALMFKLAALFLLDKGWYRDGDDPGIWWYADFGGHSLGEALDRQLMWDKVNPQTWVATE